MLPPVQYFNFLKALEKSQPYFDTLSHCEIIRDIEYKGLGTNVNSTHNYDWGGVLHIFYTSFPHIFPRKCKDNTVGLYSKDILVPTLYWGYLHQLIV